MSRIAVLIPSRDRPEQLKRAIQSVRDTSRQADVLVYVDDDQHELYDHVEQEENQKNDARAIFHWGSRVGPVASANAMVEANPGYGAYGLITDDTRMISQGWDEWLLGALDYFPKRLVVVSPRHNLGEHVDMPFVSKEWIDTVGWYAYPRFFHYCWPILIGVIGEMTAIIHAPEGSFSVHHDGLPHTNLHVRGDDAQEFFEFVALRMPIYVEKLRNAIAGS